MAASLLAGLVAGCTAPPARQNTPAAQKISVCTSSANPTQMNAQFALSEKLFAKHGLDVDLKPISGGSDAVVALLAGDFALCQIAGSAVVNAVAAGAEIVIVGGVINRQPYYLITRPEIKTPADLIGKALAVSGPGSSSDTAARAALQHFGLQPDKDVAILSIGGQSERLAAMESGAIAGTILSPPQAMLAMGHGNNLLLDFAVLDAPYQHTAIVTTRQFLQQQPQLVKAYLQAVSSAVAAMQADKPRALAVLAAYLDLDPLKDAAVLESTYDLIVKQQMQVKPAPSLPGIQALIDELSADNPAVAKLTPEKVIDLTLLDELTREGFFNTAGTP